MKEAVKEGVMIKKEEEDEEGKRYCLGVDEGMRGREEKGGCIDEDEGKEEERKEGRRL